MIIYKYALDFTETKIKVGDPNARVLHVGEQDGTLYAWVLLDRELVEGGHEISFQIVGTGWNDEINGDYIGTVQMETGLVWHIFVKGAKNA